MERRRIEESERRRLKMVATWEENLRKGGLQRKRNGCHMHFGAEICITCARIVPVIFKEKVYRGGNIAGIL